MKELEFPSIWNIAANPIFRRHAVSTLRPLRLGLWVLVTQVLAAFFWLATVLLFLQSKSQMPQMIDIGSAQFRQLLVEHGESAALLGWLAILLLQGLLVVVKGTFSVATGVAREANEGMIEAERLSPLPTGHKVLGQLFGLPLMEVVLGLLLLPWAALSGWVGGLSPAMMGKVYLIFATSAVFHHAVGLVAGTLIRQKILAGTLSQVCIILLHFVLPSLGGFGIGFISHLGAEAAMVHEVVKAMPHLTEAGGLLSAQSPRSGVDFYRWEVALSGYHWLITLSALATLMAMLYRRWKDPQSQLLGKSATLILTMWILLLTCGELLPSFWRGEGMANMAAVFDLRLENGYLFRGNSVMGVAIWMAGFAVVLGLLNLCFTAALVPSREARQRCMLRNDGAWSDGRSAVPWVILLSLLAAAAWSWVVGVLLSDTPDIQGVTLSMADALWLTGAILSPALAYHGLALWKGGKTAMAAVFVCWMMPLMLAAIGMLASATPSGWPMWVAGFSGPVLPGYAALGRVAGGDFAVCHPVLVVSLMAHGLLGLWGIVKARGCGVVQR